MAFMHFGSCLVACGLLLLLFLMYLSCVHTGVCAVDFHSLLAVKQITPWGKQCNLELDGNVLGELGKDI